MGRGCDLQLRVRAGGGVIGSATTGAGWVEGDGVWGSHCVALADSLLFIVLAINTSC